MRTTDKIRLARNEVGGRPYRHIALAQLVVRTRYVQDIKVMISADEY